METRGKFNKGKSIRKRDRSVYKRDVAGHWEADTVVSGLGKSKACFATLVERKTRFYIAVKMPNKKADTMAKTIIETLSQFPPELVKSITCDRGTEFTNWRETEGALDCDMFLLTRIVHGKKAATKIPMAFCVNSIQKAGIFLV